jgi:hypothetical protein
MHGQIKFRLTIRKRVWRRDSTHPPLQADRAQLSREPCSTRDSWTFFDSPRDAPYDAAVCPQGRAQAAQPQAGAKEQ